MTILFTHGKIASMDKENTFYQAIGIDGNKINFLGSNETAKKLEKTYDQVVMLNNQLVIPGFNDSHMHLLNYGYTKTKLDLIPFQSIDEMIEKSIAFLKKRSDKSPQWLLGRGWNQDKLTDKRYPTKSDLDSISTTIPIIFTRACGHISICNSAALAKVDKEKLNSFIDYIDIETGLFQEDALNILYKLIPSPSVDDIKEMILDACNDFIQMGITSVQTDDLCCMPDQDYKKVLTAYNELHTQKQLPMRIYQQCLFFNKKSFEEFVDDGYRTGQGDNHFKIGPLKLLLDGSLGARTALLRQAYNDAKETTGIPCFTQEALNQFIDYASQHNFQLAAHAIGDKAMDMFIEAIIKSPIASTQKDQRHGIVHAQITNKEIISQMADLNLLAYIQPIFLDYDLHIVNDRIGTRANEAYAFKTMKDKGITICLSTDAPVVDINPFENIYSAITRKDLNGFPKNGYLPEEKLTVTQAVRGYTLNGAYSSFEDSIKGSLELGKLADFITIDSDIFAISSENIKNASVTMTVVNGKIIYKK